MVDWKEKIKIRLLDFEGWPDWVAGPNGWLIRYRFTDCMRSRRPFLGPASRSVHCTDGHDLVLHLLLLGQSCDRDLQD